MTTYDANALLMSGCKCHDAAAAMINDIHILSCKCYHAILVIMQILSYSGYHADAIRDAMNHIILDFEVRQAYKKTIVIHYHDPST